MDLPGTAQACPNAFPQRGDWPGEPLGFQRKTIVVEAVKAPPGGGVADTERTI